MNQRAKLQLVYSSDTLVCDASNSEPIQARRSSLALLSFQAACKSIHFQAFMQLVTKLKQGELIAFTHNLTTAADTNTAPTYAFSIDLLSPHQSSFDEHEALVSSATSQLRTACPKLHLAKPLLMPTSVFDSNKPNDNVAKYPFSWRLRLAPTRVSHKMGVNSLTIASEQGLTELPFAAELPSTALHCLMPESKADAFDCQVSVRMGSFLMTEEECVALNLIKRLMDFGALQCHHPDSPYTQDFSADAGLLARSSELLSTWLQHPNQGYAFDCVVRAKCQLPLSHLNLIGSNVFGDRPFSMTPLPHNVVDELPVFKLSDSAKPLDGLPALLPDLEGLAKYGVAQHFSAPAQTPPNCGGAVIGSTVCGADSSLVVIPTQDRFSHVGIFGASGSGKSTFLLNLIAQDLLDPSKPGLALIDPHGTLYADVLQVIPKDRVNDVVLVDVTDESFVSSINPLAGMKNDKQYAHFISDEILALINVLFESKDSSGPTTRSHLKNALLLAAHVPSRACSFLDVARLFDDADYRDYLLSKCNDKKLSNVWEGFKATRGDTGYDNWVPYLQSRISPFCESPAMRRMLNNPKPSIDLEKCVAENKIVLFNLSSATLGAVESRIFGNLMLNSIFYAAMKRGATNSNKPHAFHLFIDEAASMVATSTVRLWAEARKFGLSLTTANQSLSQLASSDSGQAIAQALLSNTATKVFFRLSPMDAGVLGPYLLPELAPTEMTRLPVFHSAVSLSAHGQILPTFVSRVNRPQPDQHLHAAETQILRSSNELHSHPYSTVVDFLANTYDLPEESFGIARYDQVQEVQEVQQDLLRLVESEANTV